MNRFFLILSFICLSKICQAQGMIIPEEDSTYLRNSDYFWELMDSLRETCSYYEFKYKLKTRAARFMQKHNNDVDGAKMLKKYHNYGSSTTAIRFFEQAGKEVKANASLQKLKPLWNKRKETDPGRQMVDFSVNYKGKTQKLSDYVGKGKYVLVDFWASWCQPCKREIEFIKQAKSQHSPDSITFLGIASWDRVEDTKKAMQQFGIDWPQIYNSNKIATDAYSIEGIPEIILFGPKGDIVARGIRGNMIVQVLNEFLSPDRKIIDPLIAPQFPGGPIELQNYIKNNIQYPKSIEWNKAFTGKVIVSFNVDEKGILSNIRVEKSLNNECDEEAKRLVRGIRLIPAKRFGEPLAMPDKYAIHVVFDKYDIDVSQVSHLDKLSNNNQ